MGGREGIRAKCSYGLHAPLPLPHPTPQPTNQPSNHLCSPFHLKLFVTSPAYQVIIPTRSRFWVDWEIWEGKTTENSTEKKSSGENVTTWPETRRQPQPSTWAFPSLVWWLAHEDDMLPFLPSSVCILGVQLFFSLSPPPPPFIISVFSLTIPQIEGWSTLYVTRILWHWMSDIHQEYCSYCENRRMKTANETWRIIPRVILRERITVRDFP